MEFNSRETYKSAVAQWKLDYAKHTNYIRDLKRQFIEAQRVFCTVESFNYRLSDAQAEEYWAVYTPMERVRDALIIARLKATDMISARHESKVQAQRQYLSSQQSP